jgi:methylenetetrahydrofolate dehydrogenase (NADP+)/methenyltetrahydrofolate cyclohydrolase
MLENKLDELNERDDVDGILLQLPLPEHLDAASFLDRIRPDKDVDGFHPESVGKLVQKKPGPRPCTPAGIMELLRRENIDVAGKRAVVVGRSDIVGKPMAMLLLHTNATVTVCHSRTKDLPKVASEGEILVAAIGRAAMVRKDFIRPGAVVIDVGMNRAQTEDEVLDFFGEDSPRLEVFRKKGSTLVGDVHPKDAMEVASAFTPVPGGVGPLTIAMLLSNTLDLAKARRGSR